MRYTCGLPGRLPFGPSSAQCCNPLRCERSRVGRTFVSAQASCLRMGVWSAVSVVAAFGRQPCLPPRSWRCVMRVLPHTDSPTPVVASGASLRSEHAVARMAPGLHLIGDLYGCLCDSRLMLDAEYLESLLPGPRGRRRPDRRGQRCSTAFGDGRRRHGRGRAGRIAPLHPHLARSRLRDAGRLRVQLHRPTTGPRRSKLFDDLQAAFAPADPHLHRVERA
jgi:S-adenosylmethionine decarboxylase